MVGERCAPRSPRLWGREWEDLERRFGILDVQILFGKSTVAKVLKPQIFNQKTSIFFFVWGYKAWYRRDQIRDFGQVVLHASGSTTWIFTIIDTKSLMTVEQWKTPWLARTYTYIYILYIARRLFYPVLVGAYLTRTSTPWGGTNPGSARKGRPKRHHLRDRIHHRCQMLRVGLPRWFFGEDFWVTFMLHFFYFNGSPPQFW